MGKLIDLAKFREAREAKEIETLRQKLAVAIERMGDVETGAYYVEADDRADLVNRVIEFVISQRGNLDGYTGWVIDSSDM